MMSIDQHQQIKQHELEGIYLSKICEVLHINKNDNDMCLIAKHLLDNGRQRLRQYQASIESSVFEEQISNNNSSQLLDILKEYFEQQWQNIPLDWFRTFLTDQKINDDSSEEYQRVLTRTAEYGSRFTKECYIFSIVLQLIFEFEEETISDGDFFDVLWKSFVMNGFKLALEQSAQYIVPAVLKQHMDNPTSPLFLGLREYFRTPLTSLFQQCKIVDRRNLFDTALNCLATNGWKLGLTDEKVEQLIKPERYSTLIKTLEQYLDEQCLSQDAYLPLRSVSRSNSTTDPTFSDTRLMTEHSPQLLNTTSPNTISFEPSCSLTQTILESSGSQETDMLKSTSTFFLSVETECDVINECMKHEEKFQLSTFMQAGEFAYIQKPLRDVVKEIVNDFSNSRNFSLFIQDSLLPVIYLLKRHQSLKEFFECLSYHYSQIIGSMVDTFVKVNMRMIIHILLLSSDLSVSQILMTLLSKRNPVPFLEPSLNGNLYSFVSDIIYIWDYSLPTLLSFGIGLCQGKSTLLNTLFSSSFEQTVQSIYFQQTIDIDFGYNFLPRRSMNIADTHGQMSKQLFYMIQNLFEGFIIQIKGAFFTNNIALIQDMLENLPHNKFSIIILRDVNKQFRSQYPQFLEIKQQSTMFRIPIIVLPNVSDKENNQNKIYIKSLRDHIFDHATHQCTYNRDYFRNEINRLIQSNVEFDLQQTINIIEPLKNELMQAIKHTKSIVKYFPVYTKFVELCEQRQKIAKFTFYDSNNEEIYTLRKNIYVLENEITVAVTQTGQIFDRFINILRLDETIAIINILIINLQRERNQLILQCQINDQGVVEKYLSLEVLWRNVIVCYPYQQDDIKQLIHNKYAEYMMAGYPFEIVDGDNFNFPSDFLYGALGKFKAKKILVISIIGPQNSGKSTLLNYMFGTLFDVRDGRCTRGIYGAFVKSNFSNFDYVLLIDTEGLMGIERGEKEFDQRLVLFCFAVSHVVIINMIGEVNDTLKDMLTLCADTLKQLGVSKVPQPTIHFVLNQKADLNIENNRIAIEKIMTDIDKLGLDKMIDIKKENFHTLPSAFKKERVSNDTQLPSVILTEADFIDRVQDLCGIIIESGTQPLSRSQEFFCDPIQWLQFTVTIFDTLQKFSDLTYFRDVNERRQDSNAREYIKKKLAEVFSSEYKKQLIEETADHTEDRIRDVLHMKEVKISDEMQQELENELQMLRASDTIRERSRQFLKAQIIAMFTAIRSSTIMTSERKNMIRLVQDGEGELKRLIEETIANGTLTNEVNAQQKFQSMFNNIITSIQQKFISFDCLNQAFNFIYTNYNIYEHDCLPDRQILISEHLQCLIKLNESRISLDDTSEFIKIHCISSAYKQSSYIEEQLFDPDISNSYSLDIIDNLVYLNKNILRQKFDDYYNNQIRTIEQSQNQIEFNKRSNSHTNHHLAIFRKVVDMVGNTFRLSKDRTNSNIDTYHFQKQIRHLIKEQKCTTIRSYSVNDNDIVLQMSNFFQHLTNNVMKELKNGQIDINSIQRIIGTLDNIIKIINIELSPFNLVLSRHIKGILHSCAVLLLTKSYYNEQELHFQHTLNKLTNNKQDMCNYFVSMVVPNVSKDTDSAIGLAKQLRERVYHDLENDAKQLIQTEVRKISHVNRRSVQERCDGMLNTAENVWLHNYIENPIEVIENYFVNMWKETHDRINRYLIEEKTRCIETIKDFFRCIEWMLNAIKREGATVTFVDSIFQSDTNAILPVNENLKNKKRCMGSLLYIYLSGQDIPNTVTAYEAKYTLKPEGYNILDRLAKYSSPSARLIEVTKSMSQTYDNISIGNLTAFLETLLNEKNKIINYFIEFPSDFDTLDKEDTYKRLLDKVHGCSAKCPCCRRPCDIDHTLIRSIPGSRDNQHCCTLGHALRGMNGYRYEITDEASLVMCEHIKPDQIIVVGPIHKLWSEFKKDHYDWNFDVTMTIDELNRLHGKFLGVWAKIGPELCEKYGMKYVTTNVVRSMEDISFHYILLLDGSSSMKGQPWNDLLDGVKAFLKCRLSRNSTDRISILVFSTFSKVVYFNEKISNINLSTITFPTGTTDFASAFATVRSIIKHAEALKLNTALSTINNSQIGYAIIFMSDGKADHPEKQLNALLRDYKTQIKRFWTVALGRQEMNSLEKINKIMNGFFFNIKNSSDLLAAYAEIARTHIS